MRLSDLIATLDEPAKVTGAVEGVAVSGISADSRHVRPGMVFAALAGSKADGAAFAAGAVDAGAVAILASFDSALGPGIAVPVIRVDDARRALARMAAALSGPQPAIIAAVTGTNGKTSVADFTRQIWTGIGHAAGSLGTLGLILPGQAPRATLTTPDPVSLHALLAQAAADGVSHLAMEASSHGLDQRRLDGVRLKAAAFTNLSRDHLDYHGTMEAYFDAKSALFGRLLPAGSVGVLNADTPYFGPLAQICAARGIEIVSYGRRASELRLTAQIPAASGQALKLELFGRPVELMLPLAGSFQAMNALAALGLVIACGAASDAAAAMLEHLDGVPGRLQRAGISAAGGAVYIDYAHTPDALETVLAALRPHTSSKLVVVFGCGGDRDPGKRPMMGEIAARLADRVIVTDDNPRSESPALIRAAILAACPHAEEIGDRHMAIQEAVASLGPGDVLVIAGKGHERGQIIAGVTKPFDDLEEARAALCQVEGGVAA